MHPAMIKAHLKIAGSSQTAIARELGVSNTCVGGVIEGRFTSRRVAQRICEIIGEPFETVFPGQYPDAEERFPAEDV